MTDKKDNDGKPLSRTPALDRLMRIPEGFTEKLKAKQPSPEPAAENTHVARQEKPQMPSPPRNPQPHAERPQAAPVVSQPLTAPAPAATAQPAGNQPRPEGQKRTHRGGQRKPGQPRPEGQAAAEGQPQQPKKPRAPGRPNTNQLRQPQQGQAATNGQPVAAAPAVPGPPRRPRQPRQSTSQVVVTQSVEALETPKRGKNQGKIQRKTPLRIISLGGLGEIGKNITVYECNDEMIVVDCGLAFPDNDMLGVDLVIPDFTYLVRNKEKIKGVFITHGHEDHIGSLAYLLRDVNVPVYATRLTIGLIEGKLKEHGILQQAKLHVVEARDVIRTGCMSVEFIHVNHSIPDACALAIHAPAGVVIQTGDFKIDYTPIHGGVIDLGRFGELGDAGVLALLCDSTNAEKPGCTPSERIVGYSFDKLFAEAGKRRIVIATFASNVHRVQQVIDAAVKTGRKIAIFGRSMVNVVQKAIDLGYLTVKEGIIVDIDNLRSYSDGELVIISTGSQGEPTSALTRMSTGDHRKIHIGPNDYIILSASPIPGNEKLVGKVVNELMKQGAEVIYEKMYDVHVSGHACQDEIKAIIALTKPRYFMPVHGEYKHLMKNASIAKNMGYTSKNIIISDIGKVLETDGVDMKFTGMVPSGRVLVDGLGVGDVGSVVLRDRKLLSEDGLVVAVVSIDSASGEVLAGPDLVSRGFVFVRESEDIMTDAREVVVRALESCKLTGFRDWGSIKGKIRDDLSEFIYTRTKRKPMILPVIQEV